MLQNPEQLNLEANEEIQIRPIINMNFRIIIVKKYTLPEFDYYFGIRRSLNNKFHVNVVKE